MRLSRHLASLSVLAAALLLAPAAFAEQGTTEKAFAPGGRIRMDLSAGDYTIKAGREDRIVVTWQTHEYGRARVSIGVDSAIKSATVVTDGPHNNFHVVIEVPPTADLRIDVSAGNVRVQGVTGSKNIGSWAGNVDIDVPRPDDYKLMDLAVKAGDIRASGLDLNKGGLFRSYRRSGPGQYTLRVRLTAGNVRLLPT
jgi:hypothetical protein